MNVKELNRYLKIIKLRDSGMTYAEIQKSVRCAKPIVNYAIKNRDFILRKLVIRHKKKTVKKKRPIKQIIENVYTNTLNCSMNELYDIQIKLLWQFLHIHNYKDKNAKFKSIMFNNYIQELKILKYYENLYNSN